MANRKIRVRASGVNPAKDTQAGKALYGKRNNTPSPGSWRGRKGMAKVGDDLTGSWDLYGSSDGMSSTDGTTSFGKRKYNDRIKRS